MIYGSGETYRLAHIYTVPNLDNSAFCLLCAHEKTCHSDVAFFPPSFYQEEIFLVLTLAERKLLFICICQSFFVLVSHFLYITGFFPPFRSADIM